MMSRGGVDDLYTFCQSIVTGEDYGMCTTGIPLQSGINRMAFIDFVSDLFKGK